MAQSNPVHSEESHGTLCAEALIPALARLGCWSCSSSGCELGFSVAQNVKQLGQSQDENINSKEVLLILQQDIMTSFLPEAEEQKLISAASKLWSQHCSRVRTSGSSKRVQRWDKNIPRTQDRFIFVFLGFRHLLFPVLQEEALKDGEAGFLQGCAMVNDEFANPESAASSVLPKRVTSAEQIAQVFGEKQMAEIAFCDEERRKAVIEEPLLVVMPASDITDEMRTLAETYPDPPIVLN